MKYRGEKCPGAMSCKSHIWQCQQTGKEWSWLEMDINPKIGTCRNFSICSFDKLMWTNEKKISVQNVQHFNFYQSLSINMAPIFTNNPLFYNFAEPYQMEQWTSSFPPHSSQLTLLGQTSVSVMFLGYVNSTLHWQTWSTI